MQGGARPGRAAGEEVEASSGARRRLRSDADVVAPTQGGRARRLRRTVAQAAAALVDSDAAATCGGSGGSDTRRLGPSPIYATGSTPWPKGGAVAPVPRSVRALILYS
jgi:hypothetical protein